MCVCGGGGGVYICLFIAKVLPSYAPSLAECAQNLMGSFETCKSMTRIAPNFSVWDLLFSYLFCNFYGHWTTSGDPKMLKNNENCLTMANICQAVKLIRWWGRGYICLFIAKVLPSYAPSLAECAQNLMGSFETCKSMTRIAPNFSVWDLLFSYLFCNFYGHWTTSGDPKMLKNNENCLTMANICQAVKLIRW